MGTFPMGSITKNRLSLSAKINILIVFIILMTSGGLVWISYRVYSKRINDYYLGQVELAAQLAKEDILPEMVDHLWHEINTEEFRNIRREALKANDESLIQNWMISRPSALENATVFNFEIYAGSYDDASDQNAPQLKDNLYTDYYWMSQTLLECKRLFNVSFAYIQRDENKITYNLIDPDEDLLYIGSTEETIDIFSGYKNNERFPPTIYHSVFGWLCTTLLPLDETSDGDIPGYIGVDLDMNQVVSQQRIFLVNSSIYILMLTGASILISMFLLHHAAVDPLRKLAQAAAGFAKNDEELTKEDVIDLPIRSNDEIGDLYHQIRSMQNRILDYTGHITRITAERERYSTELNMAENIQKSMLPGEFPAFPDHDEFDLYASMTPAREVGGDFYDFFMTDDRHLAVLIADVSDKGVPAALFMMSSKILINYRARQGGTPAEILTDVNAQICRDNSSEMFVTVWLGILDLTTGIMTCANAGHEYPFVRSTDGSFHMYKDKHGLVVGALFLAKYKDYELKLEPGEAVFVYTDGVPEANDPNGEAFGMKRLEASLNRVSGENPQLILDRVKSDVEEFVNGAKQFDDLTMLCVKYNRPVRDDQNI